MQRPALVHDSQACPQCGISVRRPEWSESVANQEVLCMWRCTGCGNRFETRGPSVGEEPSPAELAEEFLPNLVVE